MPLVKVYLPEGKSEVFKLGVGEIVHDALVTLAAVPQDDRFQLFFDIPAGNMVIHPHYAAANRSGDQVLIEIILNTGRTTDVKRKLYAGIAAGLNKKLGVRLDDVLIVLVEVQKENWSFAHGIAQYA